MSTNFNYIKNRISEHRVDDLLEYSYDLLENQKKEIFPVWHVFILMKWAIIYGGKKRPLKTLTSQKYGNIYNNISNFNQDHISQFLKNGNVDKGFQILYNQQFYLQKQVYKEIFYTQYSMFYSIKGKYDIQDSFRQKTGLTVFDFLHILQLFWLYLNMDVLERDDIAFKGYIDSDFVNVAKDIIGEEKVLSFIKLLTLHPFNADKGISDYKHKIRDEDLQTMEMSFFTMFPFQLFKNQVRLIHSSVFNHCANYYIYDFLKANDDAFTTEFGYRLEKFFELGLKEINIPYITESKLKKQLPKKSKLVDFVIPDQNIYIECKATELQAYPYVNPSDELIFNSLKSSVFKAYFEQMVSVSKNMSLDDENWGIIITYKEFFWSHFKKLYDIGAKNYENVETSHIPPENVFVIDIYTWNITVQIIKNEKITLLDILKNAKANNSNPQTAKMLFKMHLDEYKSSTLNLKYFENVSPLFEIKDPN